MENYFAYNNPIQRIAPGARKVTTRFQPQGWFSGGASAQPNQYIRFDFKTDGFWDPSSVYIYAEVDCSGMPANTIYQLDNSAQSLIGQYISRVNGVELERVQEYDTIAAILYDLKLGAGNRDSKLTQGLGTTRYDTMPMHQRGTTNTFIEADTIASGLCHEYSNYGNGHMIENAFGTLKTDSIKSLSCGHFRPFLVAQTGTHDLDIHDDIDDLLLTNGNHLMLRNYTDMFALNENIGHDVYYLDQGSLTQAPTVPGYCFNGLSFVKTNQAGHVRTKTESSVGTGEAWFSSTIPRPTIKCGIPCWERISKGNFLFPLLSPMFGSIARHGKLLPMELFNGLEFEFLLNPYAFFGAQGSSLSGAYSFYDDKYAGINFTNVSDPWGPQGAHTSSTFQRTAWKITKMEIVVDLYYFEANKTQEILSQASQGMVFDFKQWYLGPKNKYGGGDSLNQTIQINNGFNSLNAIAFHFTPADYELYPWCRKQKRISNNITSIQLRLGSEYFPSLPIVGHAGNIFPDYLSDTVKGDYIEFYVHTMKTFGKWMALNDETLINRSNFTSNHIGYDPVIRTTNPTSIKDDVDVWCGSSLFYENNHVPRSIYAIDLERMDLHSGKAITGWNTTQVRPFDLLLQNDTGTMRCEVGPRNPLGESPAINEIDVSNISFPRPFYLYVWLLYDARVTFNPATGWTSEGRI